MTDKTKLPLPTREEMEAIGRDPKYHRQTKVSIDKQRYERLKARDLLTRPRPKPPVK